ACAKDFFEIVVVGRYPEIWADVMPGDAPYGRGTISGRRKIDERKQMPQLSGRQFPYDGDKVLPFGDRLSAALKFRSSRNLCRSPVHKPTGQARPWPQKIRVPVSASPVAALSKRFYR
ncbi:MAG: hypothetical protein AAAC48_08965, partial [Phyllobacterium sp.]|uniref:hypothetical protein n=1 Tax=Phyllobacterium sp. TaxID=1871046 RepID=UPI0030F268D8